jgi:hypothetical protein
MAYKGVIYGIVGGLTTILVYSILYFINKSYLLSPVFYWSSLLIYIGAMIYTADVSVKQGKTDFKQILKPVFICFLIANLLYYLYYYILTVEIDPGLAELQMERMIEKMKELNSDTLPTKADMKEGILSSYVFSYFQGALGGFILSAIVAFAKKQ